MYRVNLDVFEGPLDLLLFLIKKEQIDIYDIPIAKITEQYLEYLDIIKLFDISVAGEYIVMAATLMQIKSRCLLPQQQDTGPVPENVSDPREELVLRLIEYKQFKEVSITLSEIHQKRTEMLKRQGTDFQVEFQKQDKIFEASLFDLIAAFSRVLKGIPKDTFREVIKDEFTVEEKIAQLRQKVSIGAEEIVLNVLIASAASRLEIVALFLALLELIRLKEIEVFQEKAFGEVVVKKRILEFVSSNLIEQVTGNW
ncbi:hypothetical protein B9J78_06525 [bacterium Unc6]|nr:hypothetical protein [bacterium Unc6]